MVLDVCFGWRQTGSRCNVSSLSPSKCQCLPSWLFHQRGPTAISDHRPSICSLASPICSPGNGGRRREDEGTKARWNRRNHLEIGVEMRSWWYRLRVLRERAWRKQRAACLLFCWKAKWKLATPGLLYSALILLVMVALSRRPFCTSDWIINHELAEMSAEKTLYGLLQYRIFVPRCFFLCGGAEEARGQSVGTLQQTIRSDSVPKPHSAIDRHAEIRRNRAETQTRKQPGQKLWSKLTNRPMKSRCRLFHQATSHVLTHTRYAITRWRRMSHI